VNKDTQSSCVFRFLVEKRDRAAGTGCNACWANGDVKKPTKPKDPAGERVQAAEGEKRECDVHITAWPNSYSQESREQNREGTASQARK